MYQTEKNIFNLLKQATEFLTSHNITAEKSFILSEDYSDGHSLTIKSTYSDKVSVYKEQK